MAPDEKRTHETTQERLDWLTELRGQALHAGLVGVGREAARGRSRASRRRSTRSSASSGRPSVVAIEGERLVRALDG